MLKNNPCKWLDGKFVPSIRDDLTKHGAGLAYQVRSLKRTGTIAYVKRTLGSDTPTPLVWIMACHLLRY